MTPDIIIELGFRGIHIPIGVDKARVPCPHCCQDLTPRIGRSGNVQHGAREKPLRVRIISDTEADLICHQCKTGVERVKA